MQEVLKTSNGLNLKKEMSNKLFFDTLYPLVVLAKFDDYASFSFLFVDFKFD